MHSIASDVSRVFARRASQSQLNFALLSLIAPQRSPQRPCYEIIGHTHTHTIDTHTHTLSFSVTHTHTQTHAALLTCNANSQHAATCHAHKSRALGPCYRATPDPSISSLPLSHFFSPPPLLGEVAVGGRVAAGKVRQFQWRLQVAATSHVFFSLSSSSSSKLLGQRQRQRRPPPALPAGHVQSIWVGAEAGQVPPFCCCCCCCCQLTETAE